MPSIDCQSCPQLLCFLAPLIVPTNLSMVPVLPPTPTSPPIADPARFMDGVHGSYTRKMQGYARKVREALATLHRMRQNLGTLLDDDKIVMESIKLSEQLEVVKDLIVRAIFLYNRRRPADCSTTPQTQAQNAYTTYRKLNTGIDLRLSRILVSGAFRLSFGDDHWTEIETGDPDIVDTAWYHADTDDENYPPPLGQSPEMSVPSPGAGAEVAANPNAVHPLMLTNHGPVIETRSDAHSNTVRETLHGENEHTALARTVSSPAVQAPPSGPIGSAMPVDDARCAQCFLSEDRVQIDMPGQCQWRGRSQ